MSVKLPTEHHLEFLSLMGGCTGSSESTHVKFPHCWKSHVAAHIWASTHVFLYLSYMPPINAHADVTKKVRGLNSGLSFYFIHPYFMYVSSESSGESAHA